MQGAFSWISYDAWDMANAVSRLRALREAAGISQRELARQLGEHHSNVGFWERTDSIPNSKVLVPMAKILGVTVAELVGESKTRRAQPAGGRLGQVFERVSKLPRRQQQKIIEMAEAFLAVHENANGSSRSRKRSGS